MTRLVTLSDERVSGELQRIAEIDSQETQRRRQLGVAWLLTALLYCIGLALCWGSLHLTGDNAEITLWLGILVGNGGPLVVWYGIWERDHR